MNESVKRTMSAIGKLNMRHWGGVGWGTKEAKSCFVKGFELAAKTGYGRTVSNIQRKGIPNDGSSYRKTARLNLCGHGERVINWSQKSVKYGMGHNVSVLSGDMQAW